MMKSERLYYCSLFSTNLGNSIHFVVSGKLLFEFSGLVGAFAGLVVLEHVKSILLSAYAGVVTDRHSGKRVAVASDLILAFVGMSVSTALCIGLPGAWSAAVTAFGAFCINATKPFYRVSTFALVRSIAPKEKYVEFNTRAAFFQQAGYVLGLLTTGVLLNFFQPAALLYVDAASYLFSGLCLSAVAQADVKPCGGANPISVSTSLLDASVVHKELHRVNNNSFMRELSELLRFFQIRKDIVLLVFSIANLIVLLDLYGIFLFKLVSDRFSSQPFALPLFAGIYAGGIAFLSVMTDFSPSFRKLLPSPYLSLLILAAIFVCIGQSRNMLVIACCVALMSVVFSSLFSRTISTLYASIPSEISGRIAGFRGVMLGLVGIPVVAAGSFLADNVNLNAAYIFAGILALVLFAPLNGALKGSTGQSLT